MGFAAHIWFISITKPNETGHREPDLWGEVLDPVQPLVRLHVLRAGR
jgi:hypothetical protein